MQRSWILVRVWRWFVCALLYGAAGVLSAHAQTPATEAEEKPHIAALLPLQSTAFGRFADAVRRGLEAAMAADGEREDRLPVIVYPTGDDPEDTIDTYDRALRAGARLVIGPLHRGAVQALAFSNAVTVPTLALSIPDADVMLPDRFYAFGVHLESEARQVARVARAQGRRRAAIIVGDTPLSRRIAQAFADEFARGGRLIVDQHGFTAEKARIKKIRDGLTASKADAVFFAIDGPRVRQIRPHLGRSLPGYATSLVHTAEGAVVGQFDLAGIIFVDMPWMVAPDHPAVMAYTRPTSLFTTYEQERFYAIGIDAWRLSQMMLGSTYSGLGILDGVTGQLVPGTSRQFQREPIAAQFTQAGVRTLGDLEAR
jgi:outer membrane PBP1 activator LpoA protein